MKFFPHFTTRALTLPLARPRGKYTVKSFSWAVDKFGPDRAEIDFESGNIADAMQWINHLRCGVEILDERGNAHWWGFVNSVSIQIDEIAIGATLDGMGNKVTFTYSEGGTTKALAAIEDTASSTEFGKREFEGSMSSDITTAQATQRQAILLDNLKYPLMSFSSQGGAQPGYRVSITCMGWGETLHWKFYSRAAATFSIDDGGYGDSELGTVHDAIYQGFVATQTFYADKLSIWVGGSGHAGDYVAAGIAAAPETLPPSGLSSWTLDYTELSHFWDWTDVALTPKVLLTSGVTYYVTVNTNLRSYYYYKIRTCGQIYSPEGYYRAGAWLPFSPASNLMFRLTGIVYNTQQIADSITAGSEFLAGADSKVAGDQLSAASGDGTKKIGEFIAEMLSVGTVNNRRILGTVTRERYLRLEEEPATAKADCVLTMDTKRNLYNRAGKATIECPVGQWVRLRDVYMPTGAVIDPTYFFCERADFDCAEGKWSVEPRSSDSPWMLGKVV